MNKAVNSIEIQQNLQNKVFILSKNSKTNLIVKGSVLFSTITVDNNSTKSTHYNKINTPNTPLYLRHLTVVGGTLEFNDPQTSQNHKINEKTTDNIPIHLNDFISVKPNLEKQQRLQNNLNNLRQLTNTQGKDTGDSWKTFAQDPHCKFEFKKKPNGTVETSANFKFTGKKVTLNLDYSSSDSSDN